MVNLVNAGTLSKGMLVTNGNDTINNFSFTGATTLGPPIHSSANGAGIVCEGGALVLNNDYFVNNQDGLRGGPLTADTGSVTVNNSEFANNGVSFKGTSASSTGLSRTHNGPAGMASFDIQLANGGNATIQNNIIEKGPQAQNNQVISYASEASTSFRNRQRADAQRGAAMGRSSRRLLPPRYADPDRGGRGRSKSWRSATRW